jgi:hypothetical protein
VAGEKNGEVGRAVRDLAGLVVSMFIGGLLIGAIGASSGHDFWAGMWIMVFVPAMVGGILGGAWIGGVVGRRWHEEENGAGVGGAVGFFFLGPMLCRLLWQILSR